MKKAAYLMVFLLTALVMSGCETTGMSMRERGSFNYSNFVYGLYDNDNARTDEKKDVKRPLKLAVAQVGENAPPQKLIDELRAERSLFSRVVPLPVGGPDQPQYYGNNNTADHSFEFGEKMVKMRELAKDMDADYIFLLGGSADYGTTSNWMQVFDITLIGGYILPSTKITAEGRAAGALIDVSTGQVVFMVSSEAKRQQYAPSFTAYSEEDEVVVKLRDDLVALLSKEFIEKSRSL